MSLFLCGRSSDGRNSFVLACDRFCSRFHRYLWQYLNKKYIITEFILPTGEVGSGWILTTLPDATEMYYNTNTGDYLWASTDDLQLDHSLLSSAEIQVGLLFVCIFMELSPVSCCVDAIKYVVTCVLPGKKFLASPD